MVELVEEVEEVEWVEEVEMVEEVEIAIPRVLITFEDPPQFYEKTISCWHGFLFLGFTNRVDILLRVSGGY